MNTKSLLTLLILLFVILSISACEKDDESLNDTDKPPLSQACGDGICDERESKKGICQEDCQENNGNQNKKGGDLQELIDRAREKAITSELIDENYDIEYASVNGKSLFLDYYIPEDSTGSEPVIIWIHGGAFCSGTKFQVSSSAIKIAEEGYAVLAIDYRVCSEAIFPEVIYDIKSAVRWARQNADDLGFNADKIGVIGSSSGGHYASMLGTSSGHLEGDVGDNTDYSSSVQAVVDLYGPVNFLTMTEDCAGNCVMDHDDSTSPESKFIGCGIQDCPDIATEASPQTYITSDDPPFLILHGSDDQTIPIGQSENFHQALLDAGIDSTFITAEGYGHDYTISIRYHDEIIEFFDSYLK